MSRRHSWTRHPWSTPLTILASTAALLWTLVAAANLPEPVPVGAEMQVNEGTSLSQFWSTVASDGAGNFVVVWQSFSDLPTVDADVRGRCYAANGTPLGDEFQVNSYTTGTQGYAWVDRVPSGEFVVVWQSEGSNGTDGDSTSVGAQRFAADCSRVGAELQLNGYTPGDQGYPVVTMGTDGDFVATWMGNGEEGVGIFGRRFAADGTPLGDDFLINDVPGGAFHRMASASDGSFLVTWTSGYTSGDDSSYGSAQARRYGSDGEPVGDQFQVNSYTTGQQGGTVAAFDADGGFLVVWSSKPVLDTPVFIATAQRFDPEGERVGDEIPLTTFSNIVGVTSVAPLADGGFIVVWETLDPVGDDNDGWSVQGMRLDSAGAPAGDRFQLNSYTTSFQDLPHLAPVPDGFVATWTSFGSYGSDDDSGSIQARRFILPLFHDGFESGDLTAWSATSP